MPKILSKVLPSIRETVPNLAQRKVAQRLQQALAKHAVVLLQGPRHSGYLEELGANATDADDDSSTAKHEGPRSAALLAHAASNVGGAARTVFDLNVEATRQAAVNNPVALIAGHARVTVLEAQRAPKLLAAIQAELARAAKTPGSPKPAGRYLLTSAVDLTRLPDDAPTPVNVVPPALVDKIGLSLHAINLPLPSQSELHGTAANWLDAVFGGQLEELHAQPAHVCTGADLVERALKGGFLEAVSRTKPRSRHAWLKKHLQNQLVFAHEPLRKLSPREIKAGMAPRVAPLPSDLQEVRKYLAFDRPARLWELLEVLAANSGGLCNFRQFGLAMGFDSKTAERYTQALELMYLVERLPALGGEDGTEKLMADASRMVKAPKLHFVDSGQLGDLLDQNAVAKYRARAEEGALWSPEMAQVLESFVYGELKKHANTAAQRYRFAHYRDHDQQAVDVVVANDKGQVVGINVAASGSTSNADFAGLKVLAAKVGKGFKLGVVLYDGAHLVAGPELEGGGQLWAVPISSLWGEVGGRG